MGNGNYERITSLSFDSIEIYMLIIIVVVLFAIILKRGESFENKLLACFFLALPYTDVVYRLGNIQLSDMIVVLIIANDLRKKIIIKKSCLIGFMIYFDVILWFSTVVSFVNNIYSKFSISPSFSVFNNLKFCLTIYIVNKLLINIKTQNEMTKYIGFIRMGGNIDAFVTILQALMYKLGFYTPGIFEMWGIPRAKGLSHEPATNAFVLFFTIAVSCVAYKRGEIYIEKRSLLLQGTAFIICFSSGMIPIMVMWIMLYIVIITKAGGIKERNAIKIMLLISSVLMIFYALFIYSPFIRGIFSNMIEKVLALFCDYADGTNISGRGIDILSLSWLNQNGFITYGIGAFNFTKMGIGIGTNSYIILLCELGIVGVMLLLGGLFLFVIRYSKGIRRAMVLSIGAGLIAFNLLSLIIVAWARVLFFYQIWIALALCFVLQDENLVSQNRCQKVSNSYMDSVKNAENICG